jgi:hypothetical protein
VRTFAIFFPDGTILRLEADSVEEAHVFSVSPLRTVAFWKETGDEKSPSSLVGEFTINNVLGWAEWQDSLVYQSSTRSE